MTTSRLATRLMAGADRRIALIVIVGLCVAATFLVRFASAQEETGEIDAPVRISAQRLEDGSIRFGLRLLDSAGEWTEPVLPRANRFDPFGVNAGSWLSSSPLILDIDESGRGRLVRSELFESAAAGSGRAELRIRAQLRTDRRIEFAIQQRLPGAWSDHILPRARTMRAFGEPTAWLSSTPVTVRVSIVPVQAPEPEPVATPDVDPITPVLRSGWRTASVEYAAELSREGKLNSIVTVHSERGLQLQLGCFGDARRVQLIGDSLGAAGSLSLTIDGAPFASAWSETSDDGSPALRAADTARMFKRLQRAHSLSATFGSSQSNAVTFNLAALFETPIQTNIDHCGNYPEPSWRPVTQKQSGRTGAGVDYFVSYPEWNNSERYTQIELGADQSVSRADGRTVSMRIRCGQNGRSIWLGNLPSAEGQYTVRTRVDGRHWLNEQWRIRTAASGWSYVISEVDYGWLRSATTVEYEIPLDPVVRISFDLAALFGTSVQPNIDNCGLDLWPQTMTYVPIGYSSGQISRNVSFLSYWRGSSGSIHSQVVSASDVYGGPDTPVTLSISCSIESRLSVSIRDLDSLIGNATSVILTVDDRTAEAISLPVSRYTTSSGTFAVVSSAEPVWLMAQLRNAAVVTIESPDGAFAPLAFDVEGMLDTPLQGNLEECGYYKIGESRELPRPHVDCANGVKPIGEPSSWMTEAIKLIAEAYQASAGVWPGFDPREHQVLLAHRNAAGQIDELLAIGVAEPERLGEFRPLSTTGTPFCSLARIDALGEQTLSTLNDIPNFNFQVGVVPRVYGIYVMIVDLRDDTFNPFKDGRSAWREFVMHEFFHHYQRGAWVRTFKSDFQSYAYDAGNLELAALEDRALHTATVAADSETQLRAARHFAGLRLLRTERIAQIVHDEHQERIEGTAHYLERRLGFYYEEDDPFVVATEPERILRRAGVHHNGVKYYYDFSRFYQTGAAIIHLLDQFGIEDYAPRIAAGMSPSQILSDYLGITEEEVEDLVGEARATYDPDNELPALAARLAARAAQEDWDGPGG